MSEVFVQKYSRALYQAVHQDPILLERVVYEFDRLMEVLRKYPDLGRYFDSPLVDLDRKLEFVKNIVAELEMSTQTEGFLNAVIRRGRFTGLEAILKSFKKMLDSDGGTDEALVYSATPLDKTQEELIRKRLETVTGKRVVTQMKVDPKIISGIRVQMGYKIYDSSLAHRLELLRQKMAGVAS